MSTWTKKDIKALCSQLDTFVLVNTSPPSMMRLPDKGERTKIELALSSPRERQEIVLRGLRGFREMHAERYRQNCETIGNQLVRFTKYGVPDEIIERFTKLAREEDADAKKAEELVLRVVREGLPPEVLSYDPYAKRERR